MYDAMRDQKEKSAREHRTHFDSTPLAGVSVASGLKSLVPSALIAGAQSVSRIACYVRV